MRSILQKTSQHLQTTITWLLRPIQEEPLTGLFVWLTGMVCIVWEPWNSLRSLSLLEWIGDVYLLLCLIRLTPRPFRKAVKGILVGGFFVIALVDNLLYAATGMPLSASTFRALMATHVREAAEALHAYARLDLLWSQAGLLVLLGGLYLFAARHKSKNVRLHVARRTAVQVVGVAAIAISLMSGWNNKRWLYHRLILAQSDTQLPQSMMDYTVTTGYYLPHLRWWQAALEWNRHQKAIRQLPIAQENIQIDSCSYLSPRILLIIGESLNRHHCQSYGYSRPTTPRLQGRVERGETAVFTDMVTPWNFTSEALENLLSLHACGDGNAWYEQPLITTVFRQAGYTVSLLSNQYVMKPNKVESLIDTQLLNDPDLSRQQFDHRNQETHRYDEELLRDYDSLQTRLNEPCLTLIHLMGQHIEFADRLPAGHIRTLPPTTRPDLNAKQRQILDDYDEAVVYGDSVVDELLQREEDQETVVLFLPDHGERIFDQHSQGYGRSNSMEPSDIAQQYEIPFWIWSSAIYRERHPQVWKLISEKRTLPYSSDRLSHLLLYLGGICSPLYQGRYNPLDSLYDASAERRLRDEYPYPTPKQGH